jgi:cytoskeletal protein CcmA (bactofilin family)
MKEPDGKTGTEHLDEMTCLLYLERQMERTRGQEVTSHLEGCESCRTLLRALERESRLLTRAMLEEDEALPARLAALKERARLSMQWIWGIVFGLAATGVYALYTGYVQPWMQQLNEAGFGGSNLLNYMIFQGAFWKGWQSMLTLIEVLALVTVGGFAAAYFRRRARRGSALALVVAGLWGIFATPPTASATEMRKSDWIHVTQSEKIKGDLYLTGRSCQMDGEVDGDLFMFCQTATVTGHVTGDVIGFAQSFHLSGPVDGNVRGGCNNLTLSGSVKRNVMAFGDSLRFEPDAKIGGSLTAFGETTSVDGSVGRDILSFAGLLSINGKVGGSVKAKGETLTIGSTAVIEGHSQFEGKTAPDVSPQAKLGSPVTFEKREAKPTYRTTHYYLWQLIWAAAFVLFGLVLFLAMPSFVKQAADNAEHQVGASLGLGVLVTFGVPIAAIIACVTVVGLFIGLSALFLWYASLYFGQVIIGAVVGQWLLGRTREIWPLIGRMIVGVLIVRLCTVIPEIGTWLKYAAAIWGIGAMAMAIYRRFEPTVSMTAPIGGATPVPASPTVGGL